MSRWVTICAMLATLVAGTVAGWHSGRWAYALPPAIIAAVAGMAGGIRSGTWSRRRTGEVSTPTVQLLISPELLDRKREHMAEELVILQGAQELQRGVFEVSTELVGCVEEEDACNRFSAAIRRYWACEAAELMLWERGRWRLLGAVGEVTSLPSLTSPVLLPEENAGDLVLDLSPGVAGQAALVLRNATGQPSLDGRSTADQRYVAEVLRGQFALSLRRVMLYGELQALARLDPLTTTHRRWYGEHRLEEMVNAGEVVAVAMVDIDHFKKVNDTYGHPVGDQVLAAVGRSLAAQLRTGDLVCRVGGEEFLVILPGIDPMGAVLVTSRLRQAIADLSGLPCPVTVSVGVAACHQDESAQELVRRADEALYQAKGRGRDRTESAETGETTGLLRSVPRMIRTGPGTGSGSRIGIEPDHAPSDD